jgi:outer membrane protein OmpA-like peptidoglycan-associated protein
MGNPFRNSMLGLGAVAGLALSAFPLRTAAQADPARRGFDPDPPRPAITMDGDWVVETAGTQPEASYRVGLLFDYAQGLLSLLRDDEKVATLLERRLSLHLMGAYSFGRIEVGLGIPVALFQDANFRPLTDLGVTGALVSPVSSAAIGDIRGVVKAKILDEESFKLFTLSGLLEARAPTGNKRAFYGEGPMLIPTGLIGRRFGPLRLDLSLGYVIRQQGQYLQLVVQDAFAYGVGASYDLPAVGRLERWRVIADVNGQVPRGVNLDSARYRSPLEARVGLRAHVWRYLHAEVGGGTGISGDAGYGRESFRVFAGLRWDRVFKDRDGDGVPDDGDDCPDTPGLAKYRGCPDGDTDGDGLNDSVDKCPEEPGPKELQGCPDTDGDGLTDAIDKCPKQAGPKEYEGCPDTDNDQIPDHEDKCPKEPGIAQNDGCPGAPVVEVETERLSLKDAINFDTNKATIRRESHRILDEVVKVLKSHAELKQLKVEGHTDNVGAAAYNKDLSQRRAQAVVNYLVSKGVPKERLVAEGFGLDRPVAPNTTALGRAKNRRVEFTVLQEGADAPGAAPATPPKAAAPPASKPVTPASAATPTSPPPASSPASKPATPGSAAPAKP